MSDYEGDISDVERETALSKRPLRPSHYYGDNVRRLFIAGIIVMLISLPFFGDYIRVSAFYYILGMIFLGLIAGFTNPMNRWVVILNLIVSVFAVYFFESETIAAFKSCDTGTGQWYFLMNQFQAVIFLAALYYAAKTERGEWLRRKKVN
ncbi:MAG TPA: hypothetical protein VMV71_01700 [Candidatus Paceibacterota bacterium]|nr:hypothetical protein [Candidatus Paceibacterota bacterium]